MSTAKITQGDAFQLMRELPPNSIDAIITDPPYGTTDISWDHRIDLVAWWLEADRVIKENGVIAMFSQQPFTTDLINSNRKHFRYELVWRKNCPVGFLDANIRPMRIHENILIFSKYFRRSNRGKRAASTYNPQFTLGKPYKSNGKALNTAHYGQTNSTKPKVNTGYRYPVDVLDYPSRTGEKSLHPTQKNLDLVKWLVLTYTNENEVVLDPFAGSGTTLLACQQTGREGIGFELSQEYCNIAIGRLSESK